MGIPISSKETIIKHIEDLTPEMMQEVTDFIEFLKLKRMEKNGIIYSSLMLQQESLRRIWDCESEDLYEL